MEQQEKGISLGRQVCFIQEQRLNLVNAIFNQFQSSICEDSIKTHDGISPDIEMTMSQVFNDSLNKILQDRLDIDLSN